MIRAIQEVGKRKKEQENEERGSNSIKKDDINRIEKKLRDNNIKAEELEPNNCDYKSATNNAGETVDEILNTEERIGSDITIKCEEKENISNDRDFAGQEVPLYEK